MKKCPGMPALWAVMLLSVGCQRQHIPAGSEAMAAEVLLRYELSSAVAYPRLDAGRCPCFVRVGDQDLPTAQLAALSATGVVFLPASSWAPGRGMRIHFGLPQRRWNGNFDVAYSYECGPGCSGSRRAVLRYDGTRWRVIDEDQGPRKR